MYTIMVVDARGEWVSHFYNVEPAVARAIINLLAPDETAGLFDVYVTYVA